MRVRGFVLALCLVASSAGPASAQAANGQTPVPRPSFEARADIVLVDVSVVDGQGRPVSDLTPEDFALEVAGRSRRLQSARFISTVSNTPPPAAGATTREALTSSNAGASGGRLLLIVVDEAHLRFGANRAILAAAEGLLERLQPGDLVGLARLPGVAGIEPTTNRALVRDALRTVNGRANATPGLIRVRLAEAYDFERGGASGWPAVLSRECPPPSDTRRYPPCVLSLEGEARDVLRNSEAATAATLAALEALMGRLRSSDVPVTLVLISEGLYVVPEAAGELRRIATVGAAARVSMQIVRPAPELYNIQEKSISTSNQQNALLGAGLQDLAAQMRGSVFTAAGTGTTIFDRIGAELSGYYLLGFEPTDEDRNGRNRAIKVSVRRRDVTVRARSTFAIRERAPEPATPAEQLERVLSAALPTSGVPIRVATYQSPGATGGQVRVLIGGEIGEPTREAARVPVGVVVLDSAGKVVTSAIAADTELTPSLRSQASPRLFVTAVMLAPGDYTLRLGAIGENGAAGAVHHPFSVGLRRLNGGLAFSDVVIAGLDGGARPSPSAILDQDRMVVILEGQHDDAAALERVSVSFEILEPAQTAPLIRANADSEARQNGRQRAFASTMALNRLPPGEYVVRAQVDVPGQPRTTIERPFRLERPAATLAPSSAPAAPIVRSAPPPLLDKIAIPVASFAVADVLQPNVVNRFLDTLLSRHAPSAAIRGVVDQARAGRFAARTSTAGGNDDVILSFIAGLAALQQGQVPQATMLFQRTLRASPDFVGLAFFLGASHAAAGRDREAAGAWQMALLNDEAAAAAPLLVDALLRVGEGQRALDAIRQASGGWKSEDDKRRREAFAETAVGRYPDALTKVASLIDAAPGDLDLVFLGAQLLYRQHLAEPLSGADRSRFDDWTMRYVQAKGGEARTVAAWRSQVLP